MVCGVQKEEDTKRGLSKKPERRYKKTVQVKNENQTENTRRLSRRSTPSCDSEAAAAAERASKKVTMRRTFEYRNQDSSGGSDHEEDPDSVIDHHNQHQHQHCRTEAKHPKWTS